MILARLILCTCTVAVSCFAWDNDPNDRANYGQDFDKAEVIIVARLVSVRRLETTIDKERNLGWHNYAYISNLCIGRTLKGELKPGETINMFLGEYRQRSPDDAVPTGMFINNSQDGYHLEINKVYVLFMNKVKGTTPIQYGPRSGRWSIYEVRTAKMSENGNLDPVGTLVSSLIDLKKEVSLESLMKLRCDDAKKGQEPENLKDCAVQKP